MPSPVGADEFAAALRQYPAGVCLLTVQDDIDDVGTTVSAVMSVSAAPPLVAVGLAAGGYPAELLGEVGCCALTVLAAGHAIVASRFSSAGRPSARHLLESVPWTRAARSGGVVLTGGVVALGCRPGGVAVGGSRWTAASSGWWRPATTCSCCSPSWTCRPVTHRPLPCSGTAAGTSTNPAGPPPARDRSREKSAAGCHIGGVGGAHQSWNSHSRRPSPQHPSRACVAW